MNNAFIIIKNINEAESQKSIQHLKKLAKKYKKYISLKKINDYYIYIASNTEEPSLITNNAREIKFSLGKIGNHSEKWDRFLNIKVSLDGIEIETDYAGSIPVFYSTRKGFIASNIEPCTFLGSESSLEDISPENVYGFMRYTHFIWDETAWKHIFQTLPDSLYKFSSNGELAFIKNIDSVKVSDSRINYSDDNVAKDLFELNKHLVVRSLVDAEHIILPLSSGYDSRMIFSVLAENKELAKKTRCFTYGSEGSIEVESAKRLSKQGKIEWQHIELPCKFLKKDYLEDITEIFGASIHMHGMYQIEFINEIKNKFGIEDNTVFTSGFMTGVPAGQHNSLLNIHTNNDSLSTAMSKFSQSKFWTIEKLEALPLFKQKEFNHIAEERFRKAFNKLNGDIHHRAVMFDVWTRQRNFISYYPRTIEWMHTISSPHMCAEYANFFLSLNKKHLDDRKAVELMFQKHYPRIAGIASNSKGITSISNPVESFMLRSARILNRIHAGFLLPKQYRLKPFEFNLKAVSNCGMESFHPLWKENEQMESFVKLFGGHAFIKELYHGAANGDLLSYAKILSIQSLAGNIDLLNV